MCIRLSVLAVAVLFTVLTALPVAADPSPHLSLASLSWVRRPSHPGDVGVLRLSVVVYGGDTLLNARAELVSYGNCIVVGRGKVPLGTLSPGTPKSFDVALNLNGSCVLEVLVSYEATARQVGAVHSVVRIPGALSLSVPIDPAYEPRLSLFVTPSSLEPGAVGNVTLTIANTGYSDVTSLRAVVSVSGATLVGAATPLALSLGELKAGSSRSVNLSVLPLSSAVTVTVQAGFIDSTAGQYSETVLTYSIPVGSPALLVSLEPQTLPSASTSSAFVVVRNAGGEDVEDATLYFSAKAGSGVVVEPQAIRLGTVRRGEEARARVTVKIPYGERRACSIPFTLVYRSGGGLRVFRDSLSFVAVEEAEVKVTAVDVVPLTPEVGSLVTLSVTLTGMSSAPIYEVNMSITLLSAGLRPVRGTHYFIGQLSPYTPTAIPFSFSVERSGEHQLVISVSYKGYYGERRAFSRTLTISAVPRAGDQRGAAAKGGWDLTLLAAIAAVALLAVLVLFKLLRGRRSEG